MASIVSRFLPRLLGLATIALGAELILGWARHSVAMVSILPTSNSVSMNTAIAFLLAGVALAAGNSRRAIRVRRGIGILLIGGASLILFEDMFDLALGLDWESLHRAISDGSPRPGRVAPNTCLTILLLGTSFLALDKSPGSLRRLLIASCGVGEILLIVSGVIGLLLDPTLLFHWYKFNRMAAPTVLGLAMLALSVHLQYRSHCAGVVLSPRQHERTILLTGAMLLLAMGLAGAMTTFVIFANSQQQSIQGRLQAELTGQVRLADIVIAQAAADTHTLVARPLFIGRVSEVARTHAPSAQQLMQQTLGSLLSTGFTSMALSWRDGAPTLRAGATASHPSLMLALGHPATDHLLSIDRGFVYRTTVVVRTVTGEAVADLTTERPIPALDSIYRLVTVDARSAEIVICGYLYEDVACYPSRLHPTTLTLLPRSQRRQLPVDYALAGEAATRTAIDYRGVMAVVAYAGIGKTGLVMLSKVDAVEIYAPINALLAKTLAVLFLALLIGTLLLRKLIGPLLKAIVVSQADALKTTRRMKAITDNVPVLIGFIDKDLVYQFVNKTYESWFGLRSDQVLGRTPADILTPEHLASAMPRFAQALAGEPVNFTVRKTSASTTYPEYVNVSYIPDRDDVGGVSGFNVLAFDVTERYIHEQALAHMAHHDSLTGLPNRRLFDDRLQHALLQAHRHSKVTALFYLDIDHFKTINDAHGHACGDVLLQKFAQRLVGSVRASDTVARLGGDEFVILMEDLASTDSVEAIAQNILENVKLPIDLGQQSLQITTSIGIAFTTRPDLSADDFLDQSDQALYQAKRLGRNTYFVRDVSMLRR